MTNSIFIHEDDFDQIELVPEQTYTRFLHEIDNLPSPKGEQFGFNKTIIRDTHSGVAELRISPAELTNYLMSLCVRSFIKVKTGYRGSGNTEKNTTAFGFERLGIVIKSNNTVITNIYLVASTSFIVKKSCDQIFNALHSLGQKFNLILVDWNSEIIVRLTDSQAIKDYLSDEFGFQTN